MGPQSVTSFLRPERAMKAVTKPTDRDGLILEAWAQGYMVGSIIIMIAITLCNIRRRVLLHKLILIELLFSTLHNFFIFTKAPVYGWYISSTAILLNASFGLHNVIAWMKTKPFMGRKTSIFYITTVALAQIYWVVELYANFNFYNNINTSLFPKTRALEALFRDPWWIYTCCCLLYNIHTRYEFTFFELLAVSPRFVVMLTAMILSVAFLVVDICSVTDAFQSILPVGINPFWKLSTVFKLLTDSIILDDFKTALDRLRHYSVKKLRSGSNMHWPYTPENSGISDGGGSLNRNVTTVEGSRGRSWSNESQKPWISVTTETQVQSVELHELQQATLRDERGTRAKLWRDERRLN